MLILFSSIPDVGPNEKMANEFRVGANTQRLSQLCSGIARRGR